MAEIDLSALIDRLHDLKPATRTSLLPALHAAQEIYGFIPEEAARAIASFLHVPLADIFGVIDFYALFYRKPVAGVVVHLCGDPACAMAGSDEMYKLIRKKTTAGHTKPLTSPAVMVERSPCLGLCEYAPALMVEGSAGGHADARTWKAQVEAKGRRPTTPVYREISMLTANCGKGQTTRLKEYRGSGGYSALQKALQTSPEMVVDEIKASGLVGRGGAAFPTGVKWEGAAKAEGDIRYVVCNGDEAEPGTFKDRVIMEDDPHRVLEGLIIAGRAIGARRGYVYIRGEYFYAYQMMAQAVAEAYQAGLFGKNILGSGFDFDVEIRRGAGAYVCGEETALFESIEGKRGFPRIKPPFPTTNGLFGKPTAINNVETLINVPTIVDKGAAAYRAVGTQKSPGPKLFCVSGDIQRPGLYEVPFGITVRHLLFDLAGGLRPGKKFQAALFGGAAGSFAVEQDLDVRLSFEDLRAAGLNLGSGVITVIDDSRDLADTLLRIGHFFAEESCGKCYPCQIGTQRQLEILKRVAAHTPLPGDAERLIDLAYTMTDASLCGLGQTAASAVLSAIRNWPAMFSQAHNR
jgi:NADH-quinone oxidoreductase subunit F